MPRKQQFSHKQKKKQLQLKKLKKQVIINPHNTYYVMFYIGVPCIPIYKHFDARIDFFIHKAELERNHGECIDLDDILVCSGQNTSDKFDIQIEDGAENNGERILNAQPVGTAHERVNKYSLIFGGETKEEIQYNTQLSKQPLSPVNEKLLESAIDNFMIQSEELGMPKRGNWNYSMTRDKLEQAEREIFKEWTKKLDAHYRDLGKESYFERNLETWRQLWRTLERSDIVLFVCDIRYPTLHFSHSVYKYISEELKKPVILVLNKVDMVHPSVSVSWKMQFEQKYPDLRVVLFSAFPHQQKLEENTGKGLLKKQQVQKAKWSYGAESLIRLAKCHFEDRVGSTERKAKENERMGDTGIMEGDEEDGDFVTIGLIGQPNAGKSSLVNGLLGDKKVSVSKTPGHTKHFQTIFFSSDIRLCDCPGLVFPNTAPKQLQIASGMYPIAQVREPYSIVRYIAERLDLVQYLRIEHPSRDEDEAEPQWTAWYICFAWAEKNGMLSARTGRPDVYRGANSILRLVVTGRLCFRLVPPDFKPGEIVGSYQDVLQELTSFALKNDGEGEESEGYSDESESSDEIDKSSDSQVGCNNKFDLLQGSYD